MIILSAMATETLESQGIIARWATPEDQLDGARYVSDRAQHESLLGRAILRALLASYTQAEVCFFERDERGKLLTIDAHGNQGPHISLAHTRGMVIAAISLAGPIGVDVEAHRPRAFAQIADVGFGPVERSRVLEMGLAEFYRIWTLREAIGKATGDGLAMALDGVDRVATDSPVSICRRHFGMQDWLLGHFHPAFGISAAAACLLNDNADSNITMTWADLTDQLERKN